MKPFICIQALAWLATVLLFSFSANARILNMIGISELADKSEVIVAGEVTYNALDKTKAFFSLSSGQDFSITPARVLKGDVAAGTQLRVKTDSFKEFSDHEYGIFFLRGSEQGVYTLVNPDQPMLIALRGDSPAPKEISDPQARVAWELIQLLAAPRAALVDFGKEISGQDLFMENGKTTAYDYDAKAAAYYEAMEALSTLPESITRKPLLALLPSAPLENRLWIISLLLNHNPDFNYLLPLQSALIHPTAENQHAVTAVARAMERPCTCSPEFLPFLSALMDSSNIEIRRASAINLREIGTKETMKPLAKALRDEDESVRYFAVSGLEKASGGHMPSTQSFREKESDYMKKWNQWVQDNKE